jgi:hypothetical protein
MEKSSLLKIIRDKRNISSTCFIDNAIKPNEQKKQTKRKQRHKEKLPGILHKVNTSIKNLINGNRFI